MALRTFVKVGNVSNLSDARYCAGMEVDLLGFSFDERTGIDPETYNEIKGWLSGVKYVGEFHDSSPNQILKVLGECEVDYIQIDDPERIETLSPYSPLILEVDINDLNALPSNLPLAFVVITGNTTTLTIEQKKAITQMAERYKLLLGTGITPENVESLVSELAIHGIAMQGSEEIRPGYKDYDELADILEILEEEN